MAKAWDRREKESPQAYEAFMEYLTREPAQRSARDVGEALGKSTALMERWCATHDWVDRCRSFDAEAERKALAVAQQRAVDRIGAMRARHRRVGKRAIDLVAKMLERDDIAETMTLADAYRLMRGGLLLEKSGFESTMAQSVATSGDLTDPLKQDSQGQVVSWCRREKSPPP